MVVDPGVHELLGSQVLGAVVVQLVFQTGVVDQPGPDVVRHVVLGGVQVLVQPVL
jgi:hypothetical protein